MTLRVGLVAGEASGDVLGGDLLRHIRALHPQAEFVGIGGPAMQGQGLESLAPMELLSVLGLWEPLKRLPKLLALRRRLRREFAARGIDLFVGIDAPTFNTALETWLRADGVRTAHYVCPSIWAWRPNRVHGLVRALDLILCLFPFEPASFDGTGLRAVCVGHPLAREIPQRPDRPAARKRLGLDPEGQCIAMLPGSRGGELKRHLPLLAAAAVLLERRLPQARFLWPAASAEQLEPMRGAVLAGGVDESRHHFFAQGGAGAVLAASDQGLVCSGTAALEAALHRVPLVSFYRLDNLSYQLLRWLVRGDVMLVNQLAGRPLVTTHIQDAATPRALADGLAELAEGDNTDMMDAFATMHRQLALGGGELAAREVLALAPGA